MVGGFLIQINFQQRTSGLSIQESTADLTPLFADE
jgi:hypothetical protein